MMLESAYCVCAEEKVLSTGALPLGSSTTFLAETTYMMPPRLPTIAFTTARPLASTEYVDVRFCSPGPDGAL